MPARVRKFMKVLEVLFMARYLFQTSEVSSASSSSILVQLELDEHESLPRRYVWTCSHFVQKMYSTTPQFECLHYVWWFGALNRSLAIVRSPKSSSNLLSMLARSWQLISDYVDSRLLDNRSCSDSWVILDEVERFTLFPVEVQPSVVLIQTDFVWLQ